jgi:hypothetical protein
MKQFFSVERKYLLLFGLIFFLNSWTFSQNTIEEVSNSAIKNSFYNRSFLSFSISPYIVNKAKAAPSSGSYRLHNLYMPGFEAGPDYHISINKNYSIIIGLHVGAAARNYNLFISKADFTPNLQNDIVANGALTRREDFYICAPIWLEHRWFIKKNNFWDAILGVNIRYYPIPNQNVVDQSAGYQDANGNCIDPL